MNSAWWVATGFAVLWVCTLYLWWIARIERAEAYLAASAYADKRDQLKRELRRADAELMELRAERICGCPTHPRLTLAKD